MGDKAVELLVSGKGGQCVGIIGNEIVAFPIVEALDMAKKSRKPLYNLHERLV
ncbi:hypothetical protein SDC9_119292 [bioreactor metagenome]|uniref:Uncharacterized protein n=1 Tax=bioreactor metagenome TaxID=1076179 RepID=A0A645C3W5_9ZZZZ